MDTQEFPIKINLDIEVRPEYTRINVSFKNLFNLLWRIIFNIYDIKGLIDSFVRSLNFSRDIENLASELVFKPLLTSFAKIIKENFGYFKHISDMQEIRYEAEEKNIKILLNKDFFEKPLEQAFIKDFREIFNSTLQQLKKYHPEHYLFTEAKLKSLTFLFPYYYLNELLREWEQNKEKYSKLLRHFYNNPFYQGIVNYQKLFNYYTKLEKLYYSPAFGDDKLLLKDVYISPNFKIYRRNLTSSFQQQSSDNSPYSSFKDLLFQTLDNFVDYAIKNLHDFTIHDFLFGSQIPKGLIKNYDILLVLGQPGQGKTSFCIKVIYDLLHEKHFLYDYNSKVFFIQLRYLENPELFLKSPFEEIKKYLQSEEMLLEKYENTILFLDGLDEIFIAYGIKDIEISMFFEKLFLKTNKTNNLKIILTSRTNYVNLSKINANKILVVSLKDFDLNQQLNWLGKYIKAHNNVSLNKEKLIEIHQEQNLYYKSLKELLSQPILLYIIARASKEPHFFEEKINKALIYQKLFNSLSLKAWEQTINDQTLKQIEKFSNLTSDDLKNFISNIAFRIYKSKHEYLTHKEILEVAQSSGFFEILKVIPEKMEDILKEMLILFYFNKKRIKKQNYVIEFIHKSLQEYLTAEKIYNTFIDFFREKIAWENALKFTWEIFSHRRLYDEIREYLIEIIQNDKNDSKKEYIQKNMIAIFPELLTKGFIYNKRYEFSNNPLVSAATCFYAFWTIMKELNPYQVILLDNKIKHDFLYMMRFAFINNYYAFNITQEDLSTTNFSILWLEAQLSSYTQSLKTYPMLKAHKTNLIASNFIYADLRNSFLKNTNLSYSDLSNANLSNANLENADLSHANLTNANLSNANLTNANLSAAILINTDFSNAILDNIKMDKRTVIKNAKGLDI